jgi:hypothetical protein
MTVAVIARRHTMPSNSQLACTACRGHATSDEKNALRCSTCWLKVSACRSSNNYRHANANNCAAQNTLVRAWLHCRGSPSQQVALSFAGLKKRLRARFRDNELSGSSKESDTDKQEKSQALVKSVMGTGGGDNARLAQMVHERFDRCDVAHSTHLLDRKNNATSARCDLTS